MWTKDGPRSITPFGMKISRTARFPPSEPRLPIHRSRRIGAHHCDLSRRLLPSGDTHAVTFEPSHFTDGIAMRLPTASILLTALLISLPAIAKLPPLTDEAKAKAAEATCLYTTESSPTTATLFNSD